MCVKIISINGLSLLVFGCYFHSSTYLDKLSRVCILGDLNFECGRSNPGFAVLFNDLAVNYIFVKKI